MNIEQRLIRALSEIDQVDAAPDLWSRVLHSIEEDRQHRRNVVRSAAAALAACAAVGLAMWIGLVDSPAGRHVRWQTMESVETALLIAIAVALVPAIRRFGRGFVNDLWPATPDTVPALLRLLDIASGLVATGYVLVTVELESQVQASNALAGQLADASTRVAGLVLLIGVLHGVAIIVLPLLALVSNSTRTNVALPRWIVWLLIVASLPVGFVLINVLSGLIAIGAS